MANSRACWTRCPSSFTLLGYRVRPARCVHGAVIYDIAQTARREKAIQLGYDEGTGSQQSARRELDHESDLPVLGSMRMTGSFATRLSKVPVVFRY
jgi:hypothetical protein